MIESVIPSITSVGGGFFIGIMAGYFLKKIVKLVIFVAGGVAALLLYLQHVNIILVNTEKLEGSFVFILNSAISYFNNIVQAGDITTLGLPLTASITAGFTRSVKS